MKTKLNPARSTRVPRMRNESLSLRVMRFLSSFSIQQTLLLSIVLFLTFSSPSYSQMQVRTEVNIPDIPGYKTLKCDFHMHTVFSDGTVWPHIRVEEAWREGLDAIAISDHIEYLPHWDDIKKNHNRSYELAKPHARAFNVILIRGAEITRSMPPGHFNAIFLKDANALDTKTWKDAIKAAIDQGAFVFWNHPGWRQPDEIPIWYDEHTEIYENGWMHGMEIVNERSYYTLAQKWCLEKNITILGNSDIHNPINLDYDISDGDHRAMTLVFVRERSEKAIKEALFNGRTAVYTQNFLMGEEQYLKPIFEESIEIIPSPDPIKGMGRTAFQIHNRSDLSFILVADGNLEELSVPGKITLYAGKTTLFKIKGKSGSFSGGKAISIPYRVQNLLVAPETGLPVDLKIHVTFVPVEKK